MSKPKSRYFTFLLYPDSTPPDWRERLTDTGLPMAISPLHDRDRKEDTSKGSGRTPEEIAAHRARIMADDARNMVEDYDAYYAQLYDKYLAEAQAQAADVYKKVHRHAIVAYPNTVTADAVRDRLKRVLGDHAVATVQIIAESVRNAYLYLTHESATAIRKKKYVYDKADIILINNFDVDRYTVIDAAEKKEILSKLTNLICDQLIENIIDLNLYLREHHADLGVDMRTAENVINEHTSAIRMYLDGAWQIKERERKAAQDAAREIKDREWQRLFREGRSVKGDPEDHNACP